MTMPRTGDTKPQLGCVVLYPDLSTHGTESTVDVVAIPGLGAHPDWTWTYTSKEPGSRPVNWLKDPDMLPDAIPNARIMRFGYESTWIGVDSIHQRLSLIGEQLLRSLEDQRKECRARPIVFIAHSMGGNVLQKALLFAKLHSQKHAQDLGDILKSTVGIVFLGTPFRGSKSADLAQIFTRVTSLFIESDNSLINQISTGSESLRDLLYDFCLLINQNVIPLLCFFEQHPTDLARIARRKLPFYPAYREVMVDEDSACIDGFFKVALAADHLNMNKFQSRDNNYNMVSREVQRLVDQAPSYLKTRLSPRKVVQDESLVDEDNLECLHALFVTNPLDDMSRIQSTKDALLEGSCSWIFGDVTYTRWLNDRQSRPLWIHGDPGKGKTMLTIAVIAELSTRLEHSDSSNSILAYFFCDDKDDRTNNAVAILRGLLYQILCQQPNLFGHLKNEYKKQKTKLFESRNAFQTLWRILQSMLLESKLEKVYLIVDALDECDYDSRTVLLRLIEKDLNEKMAETIPGPTLKWMLISRNDADIKEALFHSLDISLELNSNQVDVAVSKFIDLKVEQLKKKKGYSETLKVYVRDTLRNKAEGTFLWVSLACAELEKARAVEGTMRRALDRLPRGLEGIYTQILEKALTNDQACTADTTKEILKAVSIAIRPLTLHELACVADIPKECWDDRNLLKEYVSQCGSLLTVRGISNVKDKSGKYVIPRHATVHLVHQSAKDFLISPKLRLLLLRDLAEEHATVVRRSLSYICSGVFANGPIHPMLAFSRIKIGSESSDAQDNSSPERSGLEHLDVKVGDADVGSIATQDHDDDLQPPSFLEYPSIYWMSHGREANSAIGEIFDVYYHFFGPESPIRNLWLKSCRFRSQSEVSAVLRVGLPFRISGSDDISGSDYNLPPLHFGAFTGIYSLVKRILDWIHVSYTSKSDSPIDMKDQRGFTALMYAAKCGHKRVVELLLERGAHAQERDRWGKTVLMYSAELENPAVSLVLLSHGASVHPKDQYGDTALSCASRNGQETVVKLLLQQGANNESSNDSMDRALEVAAEAGHIAVVQLLLKERAFMDRDNSSLRIPLINAARPGHSAVVEVLLRHGVRVDEQDDVYDVALAAADARQEKTLELLLRHGADVDAVDEDRSTTLMRAAAAGYDAAVKLLLKHGANVNALGKYGRTALFVATCSYGRNDAVVELLLKNGANVNTSDEYGRTALLEASRSGRHAVVELLLQFGADLEASGRHAHTALTCAAFYGRDEINQPLLEKGARADRNSALVEAASRGHSSIVELLLRHDADVDSASMTGWSALSLAAMKGHEDICRILLKNGARPKILNREDDDAISAVCWAASKYNEKMAEPYLSYWPSTSKFLSRLVLARKRGYEASIKVLLEHKVTFNTEIKEEDMAGFHAETEFDHLDFNPYTHIRKKDFMKALEVLIDSQHKALLLILQHRKERLEDKRNRRN